MRDHACKITTSNNFERGFTFFELLVSFAIVGILIAIIIPNYGDSNETFSLDHEAKRLSLTIREAQVSATAARESPVSPGNFDSAYGAYLNLSAPTQYIYFADSTGAGVYGSGSSCVSASGCISKEVFKSGYTITKLCANLTADPAILDCTLTELTIAFARPSLGSIIQGVGSSGPIGGYIYAEVTLTSPRGKTKTVSVWSSGQSYIQ